MYVTTDMVHGPIYLNLDTRCQEYVSWCVVVYELAIQKRKINT